MPHATDAEYEALADSHESKPSRAALDARAAANHTPVAEVIRRAVADYVTRHPA